MGDMSAIIVPKSDQINADDLLGRTITITVRDVTIKGGQEQPISIHFDGSDKVFRPCKSMCRVMAQAWGLDSKLYVGRSMTLYCDPTVKFGPLAVGGIRISHMSHIDGPMVMALTATKGVKKSYKVQPLANAPATTAATAPAPITQEQAELDVRAATTMDDLQNVWKRKVMAPHRDALTDVLNERKAELAGDAPTDDQTTTALITAITAEKTTDALDSWWSRNREQIESLPEELQERVRDARDARFNVLNGAG